MMVAERIDSRDPNADNSGFPCALRTGKKVCACAHAVYANGIVRLLAKAHVGPLWRRALQTVNRPEMNECVCRRFRADQERDSMSCRNKSLLVCDKFAPS